MPRVSSRWWNGPERRGSRWSPAIRTRPAARAGSHVSAGEAFIRALPEGTYAIITGGLGAQNLNDRIDGFRSVLAKFGDAYREIPGSPFPTEDDVQRGIQVIEDLRTAHPDLDGIFMSG